MKQLTEQYVSLCRCQTSGCSLADPVRKYRRPGKSIARVVLVLEIAFLTVCHVGQCCSAKNIYRQHVSGKEGPLASFLITILRSSFSMTSSQGQGLPLMVTWMPSKSIMLTNFTTHAHESISGVAFRYPKRTFLVMVKDPDKPHNARNPLGTPIIVAINTDLITLQDDIRRILDLHHPPNLKVVRDDKSASKDIGDVTAENLLPLLKLMQMRAGHYSFEIERLYL